MVTSRNSTVSMSKRWLRCAATLGSLTRSSHAFVVTPHIAAAPSLRNPHLVSSVGLMDHIPWQIQQQQKTRLFFSRGNADKDDDWETLKRSAGNLVKKAGEKIMSILPFGKTEEQKRAEIIKKERKAEIQSMFRDLPFPIRMAGRMITPFLNNFAEEIAEQSRAAQDVLEEARLRLVNDESLIQKLGEPLQVGQPFSQSSRTRVINGKSSAKVQASFQVAGPYGSGIATLDSSDGEIRSLVVNVNGFNMSVGARRGSVFTSSSGKGKNDIIEAEIIEKK
ncbi:hypothetical protein HJC23_008015 [Cyclotella cryptica]|uniref:Plastid lipid-associated protein/fibrillin conserved domain-containing protein n=1 Tax=Cyclotella cryptica TaxID=29204 RepID=A0ABD3Q268_9STRA